MVFFLDFSCMDNEKKILVKIGKSLRDLRIKKGYSSYETFAFDNEISRMQYWRIEKGETNLTIRSLIMILNIHNISLPDFFKEIYK